MNQMKLRDFIRAVETCQNATDMERLRKVAMLIGQPALEALIVLAESDDVKTATTAVLLFEPDLITQNQRVFAVCAKLVERVPVTHLHEHVLGNAVVRSLKHDDARRWLHLYINSDYKDAQAIQNVFRPRYSVPGHLDDIHYYLN